MQTNEATDGTRHWAGADLAVNHVEIWTDDARARSREMIDRYGFEPAGVVGAPDASATALSIAVRQGAIVLVFTQPAMDDHPGSAYVQLHGDGVADIALRVEDAREAFARAIEAGAEPVDGATPATDERGGVTAAIAGFGDVRHTLVEVPADVGEHAYVPGFGVLPGPAVGGSAQAGRGLRAVDHFAVCVEAGRLSATVDYYRRVLGCGVPFEERIVVGEQVMLSKVVQSESGRLTLTVLEPDPTAAPGQIDEFLKSHGGAGVQHIALECADIVDSVAAISGAGVEFLKTPATYYELLRERLSPARHTVAELSALNVLVDQDHDGQLFQIFTRTTHPRRTFFWEIIERLGARAFGSRNIKALYESVELEQTCGPDGSPARASDDADRPEPLDVWDVAAAAADVLAPEIRDYVDGGSGTETTLRANRTALDALALIPRLPAVTAECRTAVHLLGSDLALPLGVAPMAYHGLVHPDAETAVARAARDAGVLNVVSMLSGTAPAELALPGAHTWMQLYWLRDRDRLLDLLATAEDTGCRAVVLTVDVPRMGRRLRDMRNGFTLPPHVYAANLGAGPADSAHREAGGSSALMVHTDDVFDPTLGWADVAWLRERTRLPLVLKGILHPEEARRACDTGVDAVVVSNHGGRQLDGAIPAITALPDVVAAVAGRAPVLFDSGVRSGTDVLKALSLGAAVALVGRPILWGLAAGGRAGVDAVFALLRRELEHAMALAGCADPTAAGTLASPYPMVRG
jgi:4-hydroxymandelate oxidase